MADSIALKLDGISKKYYIGKRKDGSLRGTLSNVFKKQGEKSDEFWALKDISFDVKMGDVIGIIGKNGAGKSTLLKILSQITRPTTGKIEINGRVASLLEVGTGFHPELTGRENVFLNGTILGMTKKEVQAKFDEIVAFSGIEKFIDTPVKHYSSGMYVRLAFAVAAHLEPEILIIDEVLSVGDAEFQKKCLGKMKDVAGEGRTVLFVSHDLVAVKQLCNRGIYLNKGKIKKIDGVDSVINEYINQSKTKIYIGTPKASPYVSKVKLNTSEGNELQAHGKPMKLEVDVNIPSGRKGMSLSFQILNSLGNPILYNWVDDNEKPICRTAGTHSFNFIFDNIRLYSGRYIVRIHLSEINNIRQKFDQIDCCSFEVKMLYDKIPEWGWPNNVCQYFDSGIWNYNGEEIKSQDFDKK